MGEGSEGRVHTLRDYVPRAPCRTFILNGLHARGKKRLWRFVRADLAAGDKAARVTAYEGPRI